MTIAFGQPPSSASISLQPFNVKVEQSTLDELKLLLKYSKLPKDTFENNTEDGTFGVSKGWLEDTREYWATQFDWYRQDLSLLYVYILSRLKQEQAPGKDQYIPSF
jgi:microsomal epoxide hydrolase